ncbi:hypothetical protein EYF80_047096 [Liparis tanakae]|uniref:Uncharacterized protein n=1 Tax=Liparis tanakae TaxID=230148 RepID=A0A4Z2FPJ3_9TELE|nr:hypothetical protein EYF80_047096 [Liparis tanakae]
MLEGKALRAGCMRYWTCRRMGRIPRTTRRSNRDWDRPALAAFLHITTGPSWQWSPTRMSWGEDSGSHTERASELYLLGPEHHGHHALRLRGLGALVDQDGAELHLGQTGISGADARAADDVGILEPGEEFTGLVVDVAGHGGLVHREGLQGALHPAATQTHQRVFEGDFGLPPLRMMDGE